MLPIIGAVVGFLGSALPSIIGFFKDKQDKKQELLILEYQLKYAKEMHDLKMAEIEVEADVAEAQAMYEYAEPKITGAKWLDGIANLLISSVRPVITYGFFGLYAFVKYCQYLLTQVPVWTETDMTIWSTIICFWFGQRAFMRLRK
jgi:hypothetical protein